MGHTGEVMRGLKLVTSGLRRSMARSMSRPLSEGLRVGRVLLEWLEGTSHPPLVTEEELVVELAKVLAEPDSARLVARRAGLAAWHVPVFRVPIVFWSSVVEAARNGAIEGGVQALADAAADHFPGNKRFTRYRS